MRTVVGRPIRKIIAHSFICIISARARIDDHRFAAEPDGNMKRIQVTMRRHCEITKRRHVKADEPIIRLKNGIARLSEKEPFIAGRKRFAGIVEPKIERWARRRFGKKAVPFTSGVLLIGKKGSDPGVVQVAKVPGVILGLHA